MTARAVDTGSEPTVIALLDFAILFFLGLAIPAVSERVPQYRRTALVAIGAVAAGLLLFGHRFELAIAPALLGVASGLDLAVRRVRAPAR